MSSVWRALLRCRVKGEYNKEEASPVVTQYSAFLHQTWHFFLLFHWWEANWMGAPTLHACGIAEWFKMENNLCSERCVRFTRCSAHLRGRIKKPIISLHLVLLRQLKVSWKLMWGGVNALFSPLQESQVPCCTRGERGHAISVFRCLLVCIKKLHHGTGCLSSHVGWCWMLHGFTVGNVQPVVWTEGETWQNSTVR